MTDKVQFILVYRYEKAEFYCQYVVLYSLFRTLFQTTLIPYKNGVGGGEGEDAEECKEGGRGRQTGRWLRKSKVITEAKLKYFYVNLGASFSRKHLPQHLRRRRR